MKVALYVGELPPPVFIDRLIHGLARSGMDLVVFGALHGKTTYPYPNVKVVGYRGKFDKAIQLLYYTFLLFLKNPKGKRKLDSFISEQGKNKTLQKLKYYPVLYHEPDVFHLQWAKAISDWMWVQDFGMKLVLSLRGAHVNYSPLHDAELMKTYLSLFPKIDGFHAVSNAIALKAQEYGAISNKIKVVYSGLQLGTFSFKSKEHLPESISIVSVGRSHWKKGYTTALDAMSQLKQQGVLFHYTLVGVIPTEELLFQYHELGLQNYVTFIPKLPFEEVVAHIKKATVFLLPSVEEGIANVVLEAMALGTLVVTTDCGGMTEVVTHEVSGIVVPIRDVEKMARSLAALSTIPLATYQQMTTNARTVIEKHFTEGQMVFGMHDLYHSLTTTP